MSAISPALAPPVALRGPAALGAELQSWLCTHQGQSPRPRLAASLPTAAAGPLVQLAATPAAFGDLVVFVSWCLHWGAAGGCTSGALSIAPCDSEPGADERGSGAPLRAGLGRSPH